MKNLLAVLFILSLLSVVASATQFIPLSIDKQVEEADFAVEATLQSRKIYKNSNGLIMSDYTFRVNESFGFNESEFHLDMPGGTFEGVTTMVDGAPNFPLHQVIFLLLKKVESKIYLSNFTLGQYKIIEIDGKKFYRSEVFSHDPQIGIISKEKMKLLMSEKWNYTSNTPAKKPSLEKIVKQQSAEKILKQQERLPAQAVPQEGSSLDWKLIIAGFCFLILAFLFLVKKKKL